MTTPSINETGAAICAAPLKRCPRCKEWKDRAAEFSKNQSRCKSCIAAHYVANRDQILAYQRAYYEANRPEPHPRPVLDPETRLERRKESKRRYRAKYPAKGRDYKREYRARKRANQPPKPPKLPKVKPLKLPKPQKPPLVLQPDLQQAITAFLNVKALKTEKTQAWYRDTLRYYGEHLVETGLPHWPPDADSVNSFLAAAHRRGCKDTTLDNYYRAIRGWLNWLIKRKRLDIGIVEMIERPPRSRLLPKVAKVEDVVKLMAALTSAAPDSWRNTRDLALITLALDTGARIGELAALTLDKLDMKQRTILATYTKTGADRTIVFSEQAAASLLKWREVRDALQLPDSLKAVFVGQENGQPFGPLTDSGMRRQLRLWQKRAGIDHFNFHRLRHSYAVYTLRMGGDLLDIQKQLGHTSLATTQIYCRVDDAGRQGRHNTANPLAYVGGAL